MSILANTRIGTRLGLSFGIIVIFLIIITSIAISSLKSQTQTTRDFINADVAQLELAHAINAEAQAAALKLLQILSTIERDDRIPLYKEMDAHNATLNQLFIKFTKENSGEVDIEHIIKDRNEYEIAFQETVEYVEYNREIAFDNYLESTHPKLNKLLLELSYFLLEQEKLLDKKQLASEAKSEESATLVIFLAITILLLMIVLSILITRSIVVPLAETVESAKRIASGDIQLQDSVDRKDEIGELSSAFRRMTKNLKTLFSDLEQSRDEALTATQAKSQFLATMSHEIRTPMNGVIGMAQLLEGTKLTIEQKDYLDAISRSGDGLLAIINNVLDFTKLEDEKVEIETIPFDLEQICQDCIELIAANDKHADVEFILDYHPDCARHFLGDPSRIRQIFLNLLGNAAKFTNEGFIRCGVSCIPAENGEEQVRLEFQDTGIGIKPEVINSLFDEFTQADVTTTRKFGGTGLGLSITKKLVALMGGEIGANSVVGEGSTFWISGILSATESPNAVQEESLLGLKVLFVDDNPQNLIIFEQMLLHMGTEPVILSDSTQAMRMLQDAEQTGHPFEIAILDHNMPGLNGMELGLEIREGLQFDHLKLLIFSSIGQKGDAALFAKAGFDAYLDKLCRYEVLQSILSSMLTHDTETPIITQHSIKDAQQSTRVEHHSFKGSILVVEDNKTNQIIAKKFLVKLGLKVDLAINGQEAINFFATKSYELIFMDCRMPVMDGYQATRAIRLIEKKHQQKPIPIIALTANASKEDRERCKQSGMDDVVTKPFKRADLSNALFKWLPQ